MRSLIIIITIVFTGCSITKEHTKFKYYNSEFILQQPTLLRTDGVYLGATRSVNYEGKIITGYSFYRFYKNGQCYSFSWREGVSDDNILLTTSKEFGQRTFYRSEGNQITIETWGGNYSGYIYHYATVDSARLIINSMKSREFWTTKQKYGNGIVYIFKPLNLLDKADW